MISSDISTIRESTSSLNIPVRISGAVKSSSSYAICQLLDFKPSCGVLICPDSDAVARACSDIETLSLISQKKIRPIAVPIGDQSPYSPIAPSIRVRMDRILALKEAAELDERKNEYQTIFVGTLPALTQATLPKKELLARSIRIDENTEFESREKLTELLLSIGYLPMDPVEDPGTFAVRGEIIDVFSTVHSNPIRIEFFDSMVERMRWFHVETQRTKEESVKELLIAPAREIIITNENRDSLCSAIKTASDDIGISRRIRDPIVESIRAGHYPQNSDTWAPYIYPSSSFLDHLPKDIVVFWDDSLECVQSTDSFLETQEDLYSEIKQTVVVPKPSDLFLWKDEVANSLHASTQAYFDNVSMENAATIQEKIQSDEEDGKQKHSLFVKSNADLFISDKMDKVNLFSKISEKIAEWSENQQEIFVVSPNSFQTERTKFLLEEHGVLNKVRLITGQLSGGFRWPSEKIVVLTSDELLGNETTRPQRGKSAAKDWAGLKTIEDISPNDLVVHIQHGISRYNGLKHLRQGEAEQEYLVLEYANNDKLYLPVYRMNLIQKYVGGSQNASLDRLGNKGFEKTKEKVRTEIRKMAIDLVDLYAKRKMKKGEVFVERDNYFREFESKFQFTETHDQAKAIEDIVTDLESGKVVDRLVCGDVGFGKTEVAMRAAFKAVMSGRQVAVLVPTTLLAQQHLESFRERLKDYPIQIEGLSRLTPRKDQKRISEELASGKIDIIVGTHRILSKDVSFKSLGLAIVDEEHRFGVEHKEKLKTLKENTHFLTLTATPIPRTLHMALSGLRDISMIVTPPVNRLPVRTFLSKFDEIIIKRAVLFELSRGGQVFFVHNRVQSIFGMAKRIEEWVPDAKVVVAHGQMTETQLEKAMLSFHSGECNVLVCTTIIEAGLDIPNANTIIIDRADRFGLAQLYQLRGRVGRSSRRAYAYLLVSETGTLSSDAKQRLDVIQRFVELGSGFNIASHDLEIRGGGNLLGAEQSGNIAAVGFDLFTKLLDETISELRGEEETADSEKEPEIQTPFPCFLSEEYIPNTQQRLTMYRRLSSSRSNEELVTIAQEMNDRFGKVPESAENLIWIIRIKHLLKKYDIPSLVVGKNRVSVGVDETSQIEVQNVVDLIANGATDIEIKPDSKLVFKIPTASLQALFFELTSRIEKIAASTASV